MNPFEKIFNYQILSRLDEADSIALTTHERSWLKTMLEHPASDDAFAEGTLSRLRDLLRDEATIDSREYIMQKAKSRERQVYHPLLRPLRRMIQGGSGIRLTTRLKHGGVQANQNGLPVKLEYNMVKREWYLLWYNVRGLMSSKLQHIVSAKPLPLPPERFEALRSRAFALLEERRTQAVIEIVREYNAELSRILYAFSCFDKTVSYDEDLDLYRIRVSCLADESEFLLSKIRFLGRRVRIVEGDQLRRRMRESAAWTLARYEETTEPQQAPQPPQDADSAS
ncbi:WYL domain-containing protein [Cohnella hashimotonis]|uniref:WYL domain-containing protein n=1 Tax=Cohnella hashimotonis TaxID=2826895 RepID=A0ABT6TPI2_9BACL|nr:WYL domain-containing protein [Cohnella hashimotonis]MDI4648746.1 WYL domain-containing protein [Cohnella hashimotonis]